MTALQLAGVHHVSALSARIQASRDFYVRILGLRPLITTVNQDSPDMYHLFFGDGAGSPGSDMTVFDLPRAARERRGNNSISRTTFRVAGSGTLDYWAERLDSHGVAQRRTDFPDGRPALEFEDIEGTRLALVDDGGVGPVFPWGDSSVSADYQIRGLGPVTITVPALGPTEGFLVDGLGLTLDRTIPGAAETHLFQMGSGGAPAEVHVVVRSDLPRSRYGAGGVHHFALRVPEGQPMEDWAERLDSVGYRHSGIVDRHYFRSIYVREPNGVLFELATDGPGFEVDGPIDPRRLSLPPFLEPRRAEIEAALVPLDPV
ncbi:MAG TPA: ring-cleaving dioxygenase [Gemmatimonadales bacterium]|nr:ring-cleaving dioxygenase [Gemmatimonadales bacterium]